MAPIKAPHTKEYCFARAEGCERLAAETVFPKNKDILLVLAARWRTLAAESEAPSFRPIGQAAVRPSPR
jgi:hypothetical protein